MYTDTHYVLLHATDVKTGMTCLVLKYPSPVQSLTEDISMFMRHIDSTILRFDIEHFVDDYKTLCRDPKYKNLIEQFDPFSTGEKIYTDHIINYIAATFYQQCLETNSDKFKCFGSMCHKGLVNKLFNYDTYCLATDLVWEWIDAIGDKFDPIKLSNLCSRPYAISIYEQKFYIGDVGRLCEYCETMFGISKYTVAKYFPKKDPDIFLNMEFRSKVERAFYIKKVAYIHAENNNYDAALECYAQIIKILSDTPERDTYKKEMIQLIEYYSQNGTSVLSTLSTNI